MTEKKVPYIRQWKHRAEDAISVLERCITQSQLAPSEDHKHYSVLSDLNRSPTLTRHQRGFLLLMVALLYSTLSIDQPVYSKEETLNDYGMSANRKREREQRTSMEPQQTTVINSSRTFFYDNPVSRI